MLFKEFVVFMWEGESHSWGGLGEVAILSVFAGNTDVVSVSVFESIIKSADLVLGSSKFKNVEDLA